MLDFIAIAVVLFSLLWGMVQGFVPQVFRLVGLVAAVLFAARLGEQIYPLLGGLLSENPAVAGVAVTLIAFFLIYIIFSIAGRIVNGLVIDPDEKTRGLNKGLGAMLGGLKGLLLVACVLLIIDLLPEQAFERNPVLGNLVRGSYLMSVVHRANPLPRRAVQNLFFLPRVLASPELTQEAMRQPEFAQLMNNPRLRAVVTDPAVRDAAARGLGPVLDTQAVQALLSDEELKDLLGRMDLASVVLGQQPAPPPAPATEAPAR